MKKKILKLLESWQIEDRISGVNYIDSVNFDIIAEELAILFAIPNVSQRSELLLQVYKEGFDAATASLIGANKVVQERKLQQ